MTLFTLSPEPRAASPEPQAPESRAPSPKPRAASLEVTIVAECAIYKDLHFEFYTIIGRNILG